MDKSTSISITSGTIVRTILICALAYAVWLLHSLVLLFLTAVVIASAIEPGVAFFVKNRVPRIVAVLVMYVSVFGSLFATVYFFFPPILDDAQGLILSIPGYIDTFNLNGTLPTISTDTLPAVAPSDGTHSTFQTLLSLRSAFSNTSEGTVRTVSVFFGGIFSLLMVVLLSFYFAVQDRGVDDFLRLVTPKDKEEYVVDLWTRARTKIGLWMQGQLLSSVIGAVIIYLGLLILGVPYALLLALFTGAAMLVPIFGSVTAAIPAVAIAFSTGGPALMLIVAGLYLIVNQFEAHLIHPLVVNKVVGIPPLLVIVALIVGGELAGFLGVVLAIPVAAALREFLNDVSKRKNQVPLS